MSSYGSVIGTGTGSINISNNTISSGNFHYVIKKEQLDPIFVDDVNKLSSRLDAVERRLAVIQPNERLETEWQELRELGDKYRKLEQEILEKEKLWEIIKK